MAKNFSLKAKLSSNGSFLKTFKSSAKIQFKTLKYSSNAFVSAKIYPRQAEKLEIKRIASISIIASHFWFFVNFSKKTTNNSVREIKKNQIQKEALHSYPPLLRKKNLDASKILSNIRKKGSSPFLPTETKRKGFPRSSIADVLTHQTLQKVETLNLVE